MQTMTPGCSQSCYNKCVFNFKSSVLFVEQMFSIKITQKLELLCYCGFDCEKLMRAVFNVCRVSLLGNRMMVAATAKAKAAAVVVVTI